MGGWGFCVYILFAAQPHVCVSSSMGSERSVYIPSLVKNILIKASEHSDFQNTNGRGVGNRWYRLYSHAHYQTVS